jgi:hypothetical protein
MNGLFMSTTVEALKSLAETASFGLVRGHKTPEQALGDPAIKETVMAMLKMSETEKEFVLRTVNTLMRGKR